MGEVFYFEKSKSKGYAMYILKIFYQLWFLFLVLTEYLVGDLLGVIIGLKFGSFHL